LRYFIEFSYNGSSFFGYQIQPNDISVQEELEKALSTILEQKLKQQEQEEQTLEFTQKNVCSF
jgi:tRNA U38,U39,U40 pseudouridine synthase TruA